MSVTHRGLVIVWLVLVGLTLASLLIAEELTSRIAIALIFGISLLKADLILIHFMEARSARRLWLILYRTWMAGVTLLLAAGHFLLPHVTGLM